MKTVSVALVLCLNVGVDPPDVVKISPCARMECWMGKAKLLSYISVFMYELKIQVLRRRVFKIIFLLVPFSLSSSYF